MYMPYVGQIKVLRRPQHKCETETSRNIRIVDDKGTLSALLGVCLNFFSNCKVIIRTLEVYLNPISVVFDVQTV